MKDLKFEYKQYTNDEMSKIFNISEETEQLVLNKIQNQIMNETTIYLGLYRDINQNNELKIGYAPTLSRDSVENWYNDMLQHYPHQITYVEIFEIKKIKT